MGVSKLNRKKNVLFVSPPHNRGFIKNDIDILKSAFFVKTVYYDYREKSSLLLLIPRLIKGIFWSDVVYIWFASYHALLSVTISKLFRKKTVLVVGGYEVVSEPDINYGLMRSKLTSWIPKVSILYATKVICVSDYSQKETIKHTGRKNVIRIYNGIDVDKFNSGFETKEEIVVTVGNLYRSTFYLKGLEIFFQVAGSMPEVQFIVIGDVDVKFKDSIADTIPPNVSLKGKLQTEELLTLYRKAKVYCQLSYVESFGVALAEAMACGCIPVVTYGGALPEVVGDTGFYVSYGDAKSTSVAIKNALGSDKGKLSRKRIIDKFSIQERENRIPELIGA